MSLSSCDLAGWVQGLSERLGANTPTVALVGLEEEPEEVVAGTEDAAGWGDGGGISAESGAGADIGLTGGGIGPGA